MTPNCGQGLAEAGAGQADVNRALRNWGAIEAAANNYGIDPGMLAAVGIRESGFLDRNQIGGRGHGVGVFQLTVTSRSGVTAAQANDLPWAANYAAGQLGGSMGYLSAWFPNFTPRQLLQATAASYNIGLWGISGNPATIDWGTAPGGANGNYGSDILLLMDCF